MASIKREEDIQEVPSSSIFELRWAAKLAYQKRLVGVKLVFNIYDVPFQNRLDAVEQYGKKITERFDAAHWNPSYNTPQTAESIISEYDRKGLRSMSIFVEVISVLMDRWAHGHIFWFAIYFKTLYELLKREKEDLIGP